MDSETAPECNEQGGGGFANAWSPLNAQTGLNRPIRRAGCRCFATFETDLLFPFMSDCQTGDGVSQKRSRPNPLSLILIRRLRKASPLASANSLERIRAAARDETASRSYNGPAPYRLADWRLQVNALYQAVRASSDPEAGWTLWRDGRRNLFQSHPMSPIAAARRSHYKGPIVFAYNPDMRFAVDLMPADGPAEAVNLGSDGTLKRRPIAKTLGLSPHLSAELTLYWIEGYGGGLFLPFKDATSGSQTYGGGRYLIDAIKGADLGLDDRGRLILDFNFAYHPSCMHNPDYVCPLSPPENTLPVHVRAGERLTA